MCANKNKKKLEKLQRQAELKERLLLLLSGACLREEWGCLHSSLPVHTAALVPGLKGEKWRWMTLSKWDFIFDQMCRVLSLALKARAVV